MSETLENIKSSIIRWWTAVSADKQPKPNPARMVTVQEVRFSLYFILNQSFNFIYSDYSLVPYLSDRYKIWIRFDRLHERNVLSNLFTIH
ncbi:unnamed protein product [Brugia pahangi]|uniref:Uncharacterized protein n=1 Tax=Brugia pahangi TaxID=6280 RepID=A0A0N4TEB8_BRUPA|nr:unnamed protein product [Brugia pahangi]